MSTIANPYAPPTAPVSDVEGAGGTQPVRLSTYKGRIGRLRFLAWLCGGNLIVALAGGAGALLGNVTSMEMLGGVAMGIAWIIFAVFWVFWTIQRSHDMGWNGWTWLWTLVPFAMLIWIFKSGDKEPNRFGAPPPPNTIGVHLLAWLLPFIFFFGIVAAVAIPAYSDYTKRAKAAQLRP